MDARDVPQACRDVPRCGGSNGSARGSPPGVADDAPNKQTDHLTESPRSPATTTVATSLRRESRRAQSRRASLGKNEARPGRRLPTGGIDPEKTQGPSTSSG